MSTASSGFGVCGTLAGKARTMRPMSSTSEPPPQKLTIQLPPDVEAGHYADFASIWHNTETFILDFAALTRPPEVKADESGGPVVEVNAKIVTRVRIPASQVWEVMKGLEQQLSAWEAEKRAASGAQQPPDDPRQ